jgi:hypothetical protein
MICFIFLCIRLVGSLTSVFSNPVPACGCWVFEIASQNWVWNLQSDLNLLTNTLVILLRWALPSTSASPCPSVWGRIEDLLTVTAPLLMSLLLLGVKAGSVPVVLVNDCVLVITAFHAKDLYLRVPFNSSLFSFWWCWRLNSGHLSC